jgi:formate transporter
MHERLLPDDPQVSRSAGSPFATSISPACGEIRQPGEIASRIYLWSHGKTTLPLNRLLPLGILGGVYIGLGGALATLAMSESSLGAGPTRWLGGIAFSLGLVLVVIGGAELSTGNCLMVMARMRGLATSRQLWRNWSLSYAANAAGAVLLAWLVVGGGAYDAEPLHSAAIHIAEAKLALTPTQAFLRGVLANILVCLAVWQAMASQSVIGKVVGIVFPISAFVALGFEHSIANLYLIPAGLMVGAKGTFGAVICNLGPVTAGNVVGGAVVAAGLWLGHGRGGQGPGT